MADIYLGIRINVKQLHRPFIYLDTSNTRYTRKSKQYMNYDTISLFVVYMSTISRRSYIALINNISTTAEATTKW